MTKASDVACWRCGFYGRPVVYHTSDGDMCECNGCGVILPLKTELIASDSDVALRAEDDPRRTVYGVPAPTLAEIAASGFHLPDGRK